MDLLKYVIKNITIPLYEIKDNQYMSPYLRNLYKSQYFSTTELEKMQLNGLKKIISYAWKHSPFYRERFTNCGLFPDDIKRFEDICGIPILKKDDIREKLELMLSDEFKKEDMYPKRTGGSTSVPLKLYVDKTAYKLKYAATIRHNQWAGYQRGDKLAAIWGNTDRRYSFKEKLRNYLNSRTIYLDTLKMDDDYILRFIEKVHHYRPETLMGHAHSLYIFACFVRDNRIDNLTFKSIISTAEMLHDRERVTIESIFGKILYNRYGCEELSIIASECEEHNGLHINSEGLYVEVLGGDEFSPGQLVITDLWNHGMPLIRYEISDMATIKSGLCPCGRGLPRLGEICGRTSDFLIAPDGRRISGISILDTFTIHIPGIKQVQIIQNQIDEINFRIVRSADFNDNSLRTLANNVTTIFGSGTKHTVDFVDKIPQTKRGKYRFSICNLSSGSDRTYS